MTDWDPMSGDPFPKPAWVPRAYRDAQYWWDLTCWQRNEISRLNADVVMLNEACHHRWVRADEFLARAEAAEVAFHKTARELVASEMRAEAAEARVQELLEVGTGLQVRIAAVLDMHIDPDSRFCPQCGWDTEPVGYEHPHRCPTVQALLP